MRAYSSQPQGTPVLAVGVTKLSLPLQPRSLQDSGRAQGHGAPSRLGLPAAGARSFHHVRLPKGHVLGH